MFHNNIVKISEKKKKKKKKKKWTSGTRLKSAAKLPTLQISA